MSTLNDLMASIHSSLHSYSGSQEQVTWLTGPIDDSETSLPVANSETVLRGLAEIEDELVYVDSSQSGTLELPPFGRGFRGSTAAEHPANVAVIFDPAFPRVEIRRAIDQIIGGLYPTLYQIKTTTFTYDVSKIAFELPDDCDSVLEVKEEAPVSVDYWQPLARWSFDTTSELYDGNVLNLWDSVNPSATIQVVYRAAFGSFTSGADTLASVGIPEQYADLILYGVAARMIRFLDPSRLQIASVENVSRAAYVQAGEAGRVANQLYAMYQQRLLEERRRLLELTPPSINFTR